MNIDNAFFDSVGLRPWCDAHAQSGPVSLAQLLSKSAASSSGQGGGWNFPFPSLDALNADCAAIPRTRDLTTGIEQGFLHIRHGLKLVLDWAARAFGFEHIIDFHHVSSPSFWVFWVAMVACFCLGFLPAKRGSETAHHGSLVAQPGRH